MGVSKIDYNGETLINLTEDTVTEETLAEGAIAHNAAGEEIVGTMGQYDVYYGTEEPTDTNKPVWIDPNGDKTVELVTKEELSPVSFSASLNTSGSSDSAEGTKSGAVVVVTLVLTTAETGNTTDAVTMPYKPISQARSFIANTSGNLCRVILRPTGVLAIYPVVEGRSTYYGQIVYMTND